MKRLLDEKKERETNLDVWVALSFEPNCRIRQTAAEQAGFENIIDAVLADFPLPPGCGQCPQERFLDMYDDEHTDILYGGAAGGSKSTSLLLGSIRACQRYPGLQAFWFRRSFPELQHSVLRMLGRYSYCKALGATWNGGTYELRFPNGSILTFAHAKNVPEATAMQSGEINLLIIDERTTLPPDVVDLLYTRVRSGVPGVPCLGIRSGTNPGNIGHTRVKQDYVDATDHGSHEIIDKAGRVRRFIQAKVTDTPQLGAAYEKTFEGLGEALRKAYRDGDWDVFEGQVFSEWRYERHVMKPFKLPRGWRRYGGIDWGHRAPSAVVWAAEDADNRIWVYKELYQTQLGEKGLGDAIKRGSGKDHVVFAFDPSMMNQVGDAMPVASILQQMGIPLRKAINDRLSGWQRVHSYLDEGPACLHHANLGWETCPLMHVFSNCVDLIRTLPAVPYNTLGKMEDVDTQSEDHLADALRYLTMQLGTMSRPVFWDENENPLGPPNLALIPGGLSMIGGALQGQHKSDLDYGQKDNGKTKEFGAL